MLFTLFFWQYKVKNNVVDFFNPVMKKEETKLLEKLKSASGKREGFQNLLNIYQQKLYLAIRKILINHDDTNDALQECCLKIWNKIDEFNGNSSLYTWMYKIAINEALMSLRKRKKFFKNEEHYNQYLQEQLQSNLEISGDEVQLLLQKAILQLPEKQRLVFNLKYYDDLKYEDIAKITDSSVGSLKASYHHAVKKIENILKQY
ncbi:RNA polymerase sigma-70 factor, ECF subfamily [Cyclobacterium xiamenense]|uniref:RNA polymerase sigma-70 factor, ECF subfamily n=2 Tax=Cyclobacterium xiamenense TaxID=1297121 RepID=A0A1H6VIX6_9BACT|nr:RNA polymerase sigma-70 factor, ECF subfamily [Cyclobacterium xiamenense]